MTLQAILDAVSTLGTLGFAILAVYAFLTERVVPRGRLDDERADKKEAIDLTRQAIHSAERMADLWEARNKAEELEAARRR